MPLIKAASLTFPALSLWTIYTINPMYKNGRTNTFPQNLGLYQLVIQQYSYGMVEKGTKQAKIMNFPDNFLDKIVCGDCLSVMKQMPDECIDLVVTSPPYNLKNSTGNGLKDGRCGKWKNAALINGYSHHNDNMPHEEYAKWQRECLTEMYRLIKPDGAIFYNHKWRVQDGLLQDRQDIVLGFPIRQIIIWRRKGGINFNPGYFLPTYEVIYLITKPNFQLMPKANAHGDVWEFTQEMNNPHPAPFPVKLINRIISSTFANIVLDPFMGSGTTAISALSNNRRYIGIEISPEYIELAETRINEYHQGVLQFEEKGVYFEPVRIVESV